MNKTIVFLTGFMGSGKSTIGPILANTLGWSFHDLDKEIESTAGVKVRELFEKHGEEYFRKLEYETLQRIIMGNKKIIALGGGTVTFEDTLTFIKSTGILIYLKVSPEEALKRLRYKRDRPVLLQGLKENFSDEDLLNKISTLFEKRKTYYEKADLIFDTDEMPIGKTVDIISKEILKEEKLG